MRLVAVFSGLLCVLMALGARPLDAAPASSAIADLAPARPLTASDLQSFLDPAIAQSMAGAPGTCPAVVVVKDGAIRYSRGYGVADLARGTPVDPETTVFRVGSVSKLLTATAVLQLANRGQVDLDADVNRYLRGFDVPATYPRPVTLAELLTHIAGFEDRTIGRATLSRSDLPPLGTYLAAREMFRPLGMAHSSFAQPLLADLAASLATGYDVVGARADPAPFEYFADAPAEAMRATPADLARFMIFQLGDGSSSERVLSVRALAELQALHDRVSPDADLNGMAYGYRRYRRNGVLILSKKGDIRGFASYLALFPDQHLGFSVVANTNDNGWMQDIERPLVNRYFPVPSAPPPAPPPQLRGPLTAFAGTYIPHQSSRSTIEKLRVLTQQIQIADAGDGQLGVEYPTGATVRLARVGPLAFANQYEGVTYRWAFLTGPDGQVEHFLIGNDVYDRVAWYDARRVQLGLAGVLALLFLLGFGVRLASMLTRRSGPPTNPRASPPRTSRLVVLGLLLGSTLCGLNLLFIAGLAAFLASATATQGLDYSWVTYGPPWVLYALLFLPLLTTALAILLLPTVGAAGRSHAWSRAENRYAALVILAQLAFIPFLLHWNLLGFHV